VTRLAAPALAAAVLLAGGCSSSGDPVAAPSPTPSVTASPGAGAASPSACPPADATDFSWPEGVPADLPTPPTAVLGEVTSEANGLTLVRFSTSQSIRDGVVFLVNELPPAGYTLARGDAEASEADAPFVKGDVRGVMRIIATGQCTTDWLLALAAEGPAAGGGSPLLPPRPRRLAPALRLSGRLLNVLRGAG
jgi:hypothetical protein